MRKLKTFIALLLMLAPLLLMAQNKNTLVTLSVKNMSLKEVFRSIQSQTGLNIMVTEKILSEAKKVTIDVKDMPLNQALDQCFRNTDLIYTIVEGTIVVKKKETQNKNSSAQNTLPNLIVQGQVLNKSASPLAGATVSIKGKKITTVTDERGAFAISAEANDQLIISYVNYKPKTINIEGNDLFQITLEQNDKEMETVTISTGYQRIEQKYLTGSVTSLKMDSIMQPGLSSIDKMLEGRVPGMIYMQNSGQPGVAPRLRIRGTSTFLGSQEPLWVVDGIVQSDPVPVPASRINDLDFVNLVGNAISGINPNDVEQIDVLKDAAAAALYGVRAANGVIVVTTKRGKTGPPSVNYSGTLSFTRRPRYTDDDVNMMNSQERVDVSKEIIDKQLPLYGSPEGYEKIYMDYHNGLIDYNTYISRAKRAETMNTDWLGLITQDVLSSNHNVSVSGGNQQVNYYASLGYQNESGVIKSEYNKLYTARTRLTVNYKKFKGVFGLEGYRNDRKYVPQELGIMNYAYGTSRSISPYNEDGSLYFYANRVPNTFSLTRPTFNVLNEMNNSGQTMTSSNINANININYQVIPGLQLEATLNYRTTQSELKTWFSEKTNIVDRIRDIFAGVVEKDPLPMGGQLTQNNTRNNAYLARGQAILSRYLDSRSFHQLNITMGGEISSTRYNVLEQIHRGYYPERGYSFANINLNEYKGFTGWLQTDGQPKITENISNIISAYINGSYIFKDKYIFSAATRTDYSNAFGTRSNERFLPTWTVSGRWNMHKDLLETVRWISSASLLLSYGTQGNMLPNQTPYTILNKGAYNTFYQGFTSTIAAYPNPDLKWEQLQNYNATIEFSLFNNKLNGAVSYYYKKTTDAFLAKRVSQVNGTSEYIVNAGTIENRGIELSLNFTPINSMGNDGKRRGFIWRIDPNLGQAFNKLLDNALNSKINTIVDQAALNYQSYLDGKAPSNGKSINTFYSYQFKGLSHEGVPVFYGLEPENRDAIMERWKKMTKEEFFQSFLVESGKRTPITQGSIGNFFGYRNWSLNFTITYSIGNKIRLMRIASGNYGTFRPTSQQNLRKEFVNRWRYPGDELHTNIPALMTTENIQWWPGYTNVQTIGENIYQAYDDSDLRIVKGDYAKLQSCQLAYNFNPDLCARMRVKYLRISIAGSNLFTLADSALKGQDPATSGTSPTISLSLRPVYTFNINVSF